MKKTHGNFEFEFHEQIEGIALITPKVFGDSRGSFQETFNEEAFRAAGLPSVFKQDNRSSSQKGVVRGMHMQAPHAQGKLVSVTRGSVLDVAWDLRSTSKTFGMYFETVLSSENKKMMFVPEGFAHGFMALEDSDFVYKCTEVYHPEEEIVVLYDSSSIPWLKYAREAGIPHFIVSQKDLSRAVSFEQYRNMYHVTGQDC